MFDQQRASTADHALDLDLRARQSAIAVDSARQVGAQRAIERSAIAIAGLGEEKLLGDERAAKAAERLQRWPELALLDLQAGQRVAAVFASNGGRTDGSGRSDLGLAQRGRLGHQALTVRGSNGHRAQCGDAVRQATAVRPGNST
jgi:hypothetical protein